MTPKNARTVLVHTLFLYSLEHFSSENPLFTTNDDVFWSYQCRWRFYFVKYISHPKAIAQSLSIHQKPSPLAKTPVAPILPSGGVTTSN